MCKRMLKGMLKVYKLLFSRKMRFVENVLNNIVIERIGTVSQEIEVFV